MHRRSFLQSAAATVAGLAIVPDSILAADSELDCGVWYDAEVTDTIDGDTFDVYVPETDTDYNVRTLGHDTPEATGNTYYEKVEEWEFVESASYLEDWGNEASTFGADELPVGTQCQIQVDCESEEIDQYGRLLAKIRYDRSGDGSYDTVYNELAVEEGYARAYVGSMSDTDVYIGAERRARANDRGLWAGAADSVDEWRNRSVDTSFHPHTSSIRTTDGAVAADRVPVWAEPEAVQENTSTSTVSYDDGSVPLVAVDDSRQIAYFGGCSINELWEEEAADLDHFVFVTNLIDSLHASAVPDGPVLVDSGHHTFNEDNAVSAEDTAFYQRFLEGVGIELHGINGYGNGEGYSLSEARALVASTSPDSWTAAEMAEVSSFVDDGGVVLLLGSGSETAAERHHLDELAAELGTDLRLNADDVRDDTNNAGTRKLVQTANRNTAEFDLWSPYDITAGSDVLDVSPDNTYAAATHTWRLAEPQDDYSGEVDTITVDYPADTSLDGLTEADVTVELDRDGDGTRDEIPVNSGDYAGSSATFDLDGRYSTSVEGALHVTIDGVTNPDAGEYVATLSLDGDDTHSQDAPLAISGVAVTTDGAADVTPDSATLSGTLEDLAGADSADVSFEWGPAGDLSNETATETMTEPGSFSADLTGLDSATEYEFRAVVTASDGDTGTGSVAAFTTDAEVLAVDPADAETASLHTWTLSDPSADYSGEVDTISVDYPDGTSLDGLTDADVAVFLDRDGDGSVDEIGVNSGEYAGSAATIDLDGRYNRSVEGELRVEIDGVTNPSAGEYTATETLDGDDSLRVDAAYVVESA